MYRLELSRNRKQWRVLYLGVVTMETHGFAMSLRSTLNSMSKSGRLRFRSMNTRLFHPIVQKWYQGEVNQNGAKTPENIDLDQDQLAFWISSTLLQNHSRVYLNAPRLNEVSAAGLMQQIHDLNISCRLHQGSRIFLPPEGIKEAKLWLKKEYRLDDAWWHVEARNELGVAH